MTVLQLQTGMIYGPVSSRRLGRSLGINLLPGKYKLCSFDCVYCHYGRTQVRTLFPEEERFPHPEKVLEAVEEALLTYRDIDYITFSGNGEPMLHPRFARIAADVRRLRDALRPEARLAILSNSTCVHHPGVREALSLFDAPIMKLDAGDAGTLACINRPASGVELEHILDGLRGIPGLVIQSVLVDGEVSNVQGDAFEAWVFALTEVRPTRVQIYSTDRPVPEAGVMKVSPRDLQCIAGETEGRI